MKVTTNLQLPADLHRKLKLAAIDADLDVSKVLRKFAEEFVRNHAEWNRPISDWHVASLFSGGGGFDLGIERAGFRTSVAVEKDAAAAATYRANLPHVRMIEGDIRDVTAADLGDVDLVIGGPPCQSFSVGGAQRGIDDPRGRMIHEYVRIVAETRPKAFVLENVDALAGDRFKDVLRDLLHCLHAPKYFVSHTVLNAAEYGVPQTRRRLFVVGIRVDVGHAFDFDDIRKSVETVTLRDAIGDPDLMKYAIPANRRDGFSGHEFERCGNRIRSDWLNSNRVRDWDQPGFTVTAETAGVTLHPQPLTPEQVEDLGDYALFHPRTETWHRRLSVLECTRIQGFPADFNIVADSMKAGQMIVGNAVPPPLAAAIGIALREMLEEAEIEHRKHFSFSI